MTCTWLRSWRWASILLVGCRTADSAPVVDYAKTPVVLVHGSGLSSGSWTQMLRRLTQAGYPREYLVALDLRPRDGCNLAAAEQQIAPAVEVLLARAATLARRAGVAAPGKVDLVAHSMGAFSTRWYAARLRPDRVRTWIGIAGSNHGTDALCPYPSAGNRQMCPAFAESEGPARVQMELNGSRNAPRDETPYGLGRDQKGVRSVPPDQSRKIVYWTIRIEPDRWIKPEASALVDGAGTGASAHRLGPGFRETSPGNFLLLEPPGHDDLPRDPRVIDLVLQLLSGEIGR